MLFNRLVPRTLSITMGILKLLTIWNFVAVCCGSKSKFVKVNLDAQWKSTPIMLEASEFLAKESNDHFWNFVTPISQTQLSYIDYNDQSQYDLVLETAGSLLSPFQLNLLKFALSLRMFSPTVEMYNQIARDRNPPSHCEAFVEINTLVTCEIFALKAFIDLARNQSKPLVIKNDHYYKGIKDHDVIVILYAQLGTDAFSEWHNKLAALVDEGSVTYILRHYVKTPLDKKVRLSGYGVELAIKSTEYKAKDDTKVDGDGNRTGEKDESVEDEVQGFIFSTLKDLHPDLKKDLAEFRQHLVDSTSDLAPFKVWQLQDLSFQAAEKIMSVETETALTVLKDISQNFPSRARTLVKTSVSENLRSEILQNQKLLESSLGLSPGDSALFLNGRQADLDIYDVFTLMETLMSESRLMEGVYALGHQYRLDSQESLQFLKIDVQETEANYAVDIRDPSVIYINDLERDRKYAGWPSSVQDLLRPTFPGMLRHIRKNLFHMVLFVDPADRQSSAMIKMAEAFYVHSAPVRIGLVFVVNQDESVDGNTDAGVAMLRAFNFISQRDGPVKALSFLTDIYDKIGDEEVSLQLITDALNSHTDQKTVQSVVADGSEYDSMRKESAAFFDRTGLGDLPRVLINGVPLKKEEVRDEFEETVVRTILRLTGELQKAVYNGFLQDSMDTFDYIMTRSNVMPRLNSRILGTSEKYLDLTQLALSTAILDPVRLQNFNPGKLSGAIAASLKYLSKKDEPALRPVTHWIVTDLDTPIGREFLYEAVKQLKHTNSVRVGIIHNLYDLPTGSKQQSDFHVSVAVQAALDALNPGMAKSFITKLLKEENFVELKNGRLTLKELAVHNMDFAAYESAMKDFGVSLFQSHRLFCHKVLEFKLGQRGVITNGRVIGPLKDGEKFIEEDFNLLEKFTMASSAGKIEKKVKTFGLEESKASDLVMKLEALLLSVPQKEARKDVALLSTSHSVIKIPPKSKGPAFEIVAVLDPTTRAAQKYTPLIMVLHEVANVNITVFLNCREKLSEMPLKSYYRYVLEPEMDFSEESKSSGPHALFYDMPQSPLLTLGMDPPEAWLVESVKTQYDLDNIFLEEVESGVKADFELEFLLLEGHCYDMVTGNPPRGLQFVLGTNSTPALVDTIVMANLGYFQMKARPGLWFLHLRSGRSQEIYDIVSQDYTDSPPNSSDVITVMDSFKSKIIRIKVSKIPGKENEDLLSEDEPNMGLWDSISSKFGGGSKSDDEDAVDPVINIFSLASGHLYERFLRIMMLSVLNHTQSKVKFWFLKNYLSPSFKDFIPHMAKKYGFEYELVQYKWPRWLHQQTEKQRIIWGYKILFLDVLFPLNVNKIIFVDADQTVRADLKELHDLDLEGAPYGYTPFCDSRKDMDGYRFWKSGYWSNHLGHRKYHISALYVVDLKKFRKVAAGDRLRGQYQGLSQDPNSLSNLDQDLPNNMIHQVSIKSLPQEWLWCETWCSDDEKSRAKTIDLCNNPKTKEPKLQAAMRIVSEWNDYDSEIKQLWDQVYKNKTMAVEAKDSQSETSGPDRTAEGSDKGRIEL